MCWGGGVLKSSVHSIIQYNCCRGTILSSKSQACPALAVMFYIFVCPFVFVCVCVTDVTVTRA